MTAAKSSGIARFLRAGPIMMVLGALLALGGIVGTTASTNGGNQSCPAGTVLIAKFNYSHGYSFDSPSGNQNVVSLSNADEEGATWHSSLKVSYVIVKGGVNSVLYTISPSKFDGNFSNQGLPLDSHHNRPDISNVQFCGVSAVATTTTSSTSSTSTTTTKPTTTTCGQCQTTTTTQPTTTTCGQCQSTTTTQPTTTTCGQCQSTTTTHPTTTTCHCETTTTHPPVTTTCHCSTTTTHPTTTTHGETTSTTEATTTTVVGSTTSSTQVAGTTIVGHTTTTVRNHHVTTTTSKSGALGTTFKPYVTSTSLLTPDGGTQLPFTGSSSTPLIALGIILLATGLTITLSQSRRDRSRA